MKIGLVAIDQPYGISDEFMDIEPADMSLRQRWQPLMRKARLL